jgi:hypothetical protein
MKLMIDSAFPQGSVPAGFHAVAGYLGGDTPHAWTKNEWGAFSTHRKLPIWVPAIAVGGSDSARSEAFSALSQLYHLGVPKGKAMVLDVEGAENPGYVTSFYNVIKWAGFKMWVYGSASTVFVNPACDGYWVADWTGTPHQYQKSFVRATQYASNIMLKTGYDASEVKWYQWKFNLWT